MALTDRPDFQAWLARYEADQRRVHGGALLPVADHCDGCGEPLAEPPLTATNWCLVCLAEQYGRDRSAAAAHIAAALRSAIVRDDGATPASDIRAAIEDVLTDYENG